MLCSDRNETLWECPQHACDQALHSTRKENCRPYRQFLAEASLEKAGEKRRRQGKSKPACAGMKEGGCQEEEGVGVWQDQPA